ncbi:MAG: DMT family transporter [Bacteroidetes bacterium]|nr:DMT family transporter [Bacteroidota bacterium]
MDKIKTKQNKIKAFLLMLGWCFFFSLLVTVVKKLSKDLEKPLVIWSRLLFGICFSIPIILRKKISKPSKKSIKWYLLRTVTVYVSMLCTYYAYSNLPILTATAIGYTEPMMQVFIAMIFLHEKVNLQKWLLIIVGYIGVYLAINPSSFSANSLGLFVAILANFLSSGAKVIAKHITSLEPSHQMIFYGDTLLFMIASIFVIPFFQIPSLSSLKLLILLGFLGYIAKLCFTLAIKLANINFIAPVTYMRIFISIPLSFYFFNEVPSVITMIGSLVIIISNYLLFKYNS